MGGAGVDLFFVISGFVMMLSAQPLFGCHGASKQFLYRRITRVVPLYWLATFVYLGLQLWFHGLSLSPPTPNVYPRTIAGLFFVPLTSKAFSPLLPVGWSLNFEMLFYFIFAFAIRFRQPVALILVASTICTLSIIGLTCKWLGCICLQCHCDRIRLWDRYRLFQNKEEIDTDCTCGVAFHRRFFCALHNSAVPGTVSRT